MNRVPGWGARRASHHVEHPVRWPRWWPVVVVSLVGVALLLTSGLVFQERARRLGRIGVWLADPARHASWQVQGGRRCGDAPMLMPTSGYIGVSWREGLPPLYEHSGFDIFSPDGADNVTPVVAAYDGYLTREETWLSTVIIRHPDFPAVDGVSELSAGEQLWTYYTHMASRDGRISYVSAQFPPGTQETFVEAGTLLGYQGTWAGNPRRPMGRHLHFSVVRSSADGGYANETRPDNTFDPAPFLGVRPRPDGIYRCAD